MEGEGDGGQVRHPRQGTPQGGVISPLLANIYLHELDKRWLERGGPGERYGAGLVRYADDFVIMVRTISGQLSAEVEQIVEGTLGLKLNREKTRVVNLLEEGASLDFLGFTFRRDKDRYGRERRYLNIEASEKAQARLREKIRRIVDSGNKSPLKLMIGELNKLLNGCVGLLPVRLSGEDLPEGQSLRAGAADAASAASEPTAHAAEGQECVRSPEGRRTGVPMRPGPSTSCACL